MPKIRFSKQALQSHLFAYLLAWGLIACLVGHSRTADAQTMNALYFDGQGAYVELPAPMFHQFTASTIEVWVKWDDIHNWSRVFDFGREGNAMVVQSEKSSRTLNFAIYDRNGSRHRIQANNAIPVGQWFHIAVTSGPQGMALYLNGNLVGTDEYTGGMEQVTGGSYYLGRSNWPDDKPFQGYMSEFRMWNRQRTQTEIRRTMERRLTGKEPNLVAYWHLDQMNGAELPNVAGEATARAVANARIASIPQIARYLVPGEMEKEKKARQISAQAHFQKGDFLNAYWDYQAALDLGPGDAQTRMAMLETLKKSQMRVALLPFQTTELNIDTELAYHTAYTTVAQSRPAYLEWLTPATTQFALYEQGVATTSDQQTLINAAKTWGIRLIVLCTIQNVNTDQSRSKRDTETAYIRTPSQTLSDSLSSVRYTLISQSAYAKSQASVQIIDVETGRVIDNQTLFAEAEDQIEYADYSGDQYALWSKRGARYSRLVDQEPRFFARKKLQSDQELTTLVLQKLGQDIAQRIQSVLTTYHP